MALAEWSQWDDEMDWLLRYELVAAYVRRKKYEAELIAQAVGRMLLGGDGAPAGRSGVAGGGRYRRVSADGLLKEMGVALA